MAKNVKAEPDSKNTVIYTDDSGKQWVHRGTRTWRNNNPGNLVVGNISRDNNQGVRIKTHVISHC